MAGKTVNRQHDCFQRALTLGMNTLEAIRVQGKITGALASRRMATVDAFMAESPGQNTSRRQQMIRSVAAIEAALEVFAESKDPLVAAFARKDLALIRDLLGEFDPTPNRMPRNIRAEVDAAKAQLQ